MTETRVEVIERAVLLHSLFRRAMVLRPADESLLVTINIPDFRDRANPEDHILLRPSLNSLGTSAFSRPEDSHIILSSHPPVDSPSSLSVSTETLVPGRRGGEKGGDVALCTGSLGWQEGEHPAGFVQSLEPGW